MMSLEKHTLRENQTLSFFKNTIEPSCPKVLNDIYHSSLNTNCEGIFWKSEKFMRSPNRPTVSINDIKHNKLSYNIGNLLIATNLKSASQTFALDTDLILLWESYYYYFKKERILSLKQK